MKTVAHFLQSPKFHRGFRVLLILLLIFNLIDLPDRLRSGSRAPYNGVLLALTLLSNDLASYPPFSERTGRGKWAAGVAFAFSACALVYMFWEWFAAAR